MMHNKLQHSSCSVSSNPDVLTKEQRIQFVGLNQGFPTWGKCTTRSTFSHLKGYV